MLTSLPVLLSPQKLHIPDGFLSVPLALVGWVLAALLIALALRHTRNQLGERQIPILGVMAAFIFAAQAINFPVAGGTSGHLLGGALAAIILGPWAATLVMTAVVGLQGLLFQDGGLLVMGWNIVNMGILTAFTGTFVYSVARRVLGKNRGALYAAAFLGAWLSVQVGAVATAAELSLSGIIPVNISMPAMLSVHALIGIGEGLITVGAIALIAGARPDLLEGRVSEGRATAGFVLVGLLVSLVVAVLSLFASPSPDGLERVAQDQGFLQQALEPVYSILPDYTLPFIDNPELTGVLALVLGVLIVFGFVLLVARLLRRPKMASHR